MVAKGEKARKRPRSQEQEEADEVQKWAEQGCLVDLEETAEKTTEELAPLSRRALQPFRKRRTVEIDGWLCVLTRASKSAEEDDGNQQDGKQESDPEGPDGGKPSQSDGGKPSQEVRPSDPLIPVKSPKAIELSGGVTFSVEQRAQIWSMMEKFAAENRAPVAPLPQTDEKAFDAFLDDDGGKPIDAFDPLNYFDPQCGRRDAPIRDPAIRDAPTPRHGVAIKNPGPIPVFNGDVSALAVDEWAQTLSSWLAAQSIFVNEKTSWPAIWGTICSGATTGVARTLIQKWSLEDWPSSWNVFVERLHSQFCEVAPQERAAEELALLRCTGPVQAYNLRFLALAAKAGTVLSPTALRLTYLNGLRSNTQTGVRFWCNMQHTEAGGATLEQAMKAAVVYERGQQPESSVATVTYDNGAGRFNNNGAGRFNGNSSGRRKPFRYVPGQVPRDIAMRDGLCTWCGIRGHLRVKCHRYIAHMKENENLEKSVVKDGNSASCGNISISHKIDAHNPSAIDKNVTEDNNVSQQKPDSVTDYIPESNALQQNAHRCCDENQSQQPDASLTAHLTAVQTTKLMTQKGAQLPQERIQINASDVLEIPGFLGDPRVRVRILLDSGSTYNLCSPAIAQQLLAQGAATRTSTSHHFF